MRRLEERQDLEIQTNTPLAPYTTLRVGGTPKALISAKTFEGAIAVFDYAHETNIPVLVLGGGSNLVIDDGDLDLIALQLPGYDGGAEHIQIDSETGFVEASAGVVLDNLIERVVNVGLGGIECLSGIPGSVGATPIQNVGAYGTEIASSLTEMLIYDRDNKTLEWTPVSELGLGYRTSNLKFQDRKIVFSVRLQLTNDGLSAPLIYDGIITATGAQYGQRKDVALVREKVLDQRMKRGMVVVEEDHDTWSTGSFFVNPVVQDLDEVKALVLAKHGEEAVESMPSYDLGESGIKLSAAWLIEHAGFPKGYPSGGQITLSTKHTLAITNRGAGTAREVWSLANEIVAGVKKVFNVTLIPEAVKAPK